jgi:hypothetical protein
MSALVICRSLLHPASFGKYGLKSFMCGFARASPLFPNRQRRFSGLTRHSLNTSERT